jgi:hypothetical protein
MVLTRRWALFLVVVGVWSWVIWPRFALAIVQDEHSFSGGAPTAFFWVHALLIVTSLAFGTVLGLLGVRVWRTTPNKTRQTEEFAGVERSAPQD